MKVIGGFLCEKNGFGCTVVSGEEVTDHSIVVRPDLVANRPAALSWLLEEAERFLTSHAIDEVRLAQGASGGRFQASGERTEVETCLKIATARVGVPLIAMTKESVRAAHGLAKGTGAYEQLLAQPDVQARSNNDRRFQYLMAKAPLG
jgi:hypothetical protein